MKNLFLVMDKITAAGNVAHVEEVSPADNLKKYADRDEIKSINAHTVQKQAEEQARALNESHKARGVYLYQ